MHLPTHILSGWCVGNLLPFGARERLFCMIAATIADADGISFLFGQEAYWDCHHVLGHNLVFGLLSSAGLAWFSARRVLGFVAYFALFHLHLLMDYYGSGPNWPILYFWPFERAMSRGWLNPEPWELISWQNGLAALPIVVGTVLIAVYRRRTPLELISASMEQRILSRPRHRKTGAD